MTLLTDEQVAQFGRDGFFHYGNVLAVDELNELRTALKRVENGTSESSAELNRNISANQDQGFVVKQIVNIFQAEPAFYRHLYNDRIVPLVARLMNTDTVRVWHDQIQIKPAQVGGPTTWHQDYPYWPVIEPGDLVSAWVALEDADNANGCMSMVRGSHKWGAYHDGTIGTDMETYLPNPTDLSIVPKGEIIEVVDCPVKAGSLLFHHCLTWHGAPINRTDRPRPAIAVHYMPGHTIYAPKGKAHAVEHHIEVAPGERLMGDHFPTVMENGVILKP